jgi:hypothetical protein
MNAESQKLHLKEMDSLRGVELENTNVTEAGIAELQKALPTTRITK